MPSLSVCMMVQNSDKTLTIALESLANVYDKLIIVDGGSNDSTCDIALSYGATIIHSPWLGNHSQQRNVYLNAVNTDWVFVLDSDEFINSQLLEFLQLIKLPRTQINTDNFWIDRKWISPFSKNHYITSKPHSPDFQRRLFKYNKQIFYTGQIHETIHNLLDQGQCLAELSIYRLDLFINSEEKRRDKIRKYQQSDPRNGGRHYYLPDHQELKISQCNHEDILYSVQVLLQKINNNPLANSELNSLIPAEIKNDDFYYAIQKIAQEEDIKTVLEIGSSSGEGSSKAFVTGLRENRNKPILFCMEVSKTRFTELQNKYKNEDFVKCYNVSSISVRKFPDEKEIIDFYNSHDTNLNLYPLERVLGWLRQDIEYVNNSGVSDNGIQKIKHENKIDCFDLVLIDGSEFTGEAELDEVYGANFICLDDITTFKNYKNFNRLLSDSDYILIISNQNIRNGYAIFQRKTVQLVSYQNIHDAVESIEGFMVSGQEEYLFNKVKSLPEDAVIVEIGSFKGRSTVAMAYACIGTKRKIYSIDTWDGNDADFPERQFFKVWQQNVQLNGLEHYVTPLRGYSHDVLKRWDKLTNSKDIDFIFIDGSHQYLDVLKDFELSFSLVKNGGWIAFHDVVPTWPGPERVWHNIAKLRLVNHEYSSTLACGQKSLAPITSISTPELPIHFFTIVLNGQPFIRYHIEIFKQLPFKWHWHIVEGVAELKHDTSWSLNLGGSISDKIHDNGRSYDGTTEYLDKLTTQYPDNITVYRKPEGMYWNGKREMINEPLFNIHEECLLWQIDADELWKVEQIFSARQMFIDNPNKTAAYYWCWYFVGENLIISTRNCYTQNPQQEWLRTWRYKPGSVWVAHEPPTLEEPSANGQWHNVAAVNPFLHQETERHGLVFQHFAYVTEEQLRFKEQYYGYRNAFSHWKALQETTKFPVLLRDYFYWVLDEAQVNVADSLEIIPIAQRELSSNSWHFLQPDELQQQITHIKKLAPIILVDAVFFQINTTGIARVWKSLLEEWVNSGFANHITVLDRTGTAPKIPGIKYRTIASYDYNNTDADREMLQQVCDEEGAEIFISSYYTTPTTTPSVFIAHDMIPEVMGWDLNSPMWREKHQAIQNASQYIAVSEHTARDLVRYFPEINRESITIAHCGVESGFSPANIQEINNFKTKYGITKPYFMLVGIENNYKNSILFFQAFSQLASSSGFDIVCTGNRGTLAPEFRGYTLGSIVHILQLSDQELATAYSGAVALAYPSKYEGFGLPIVEAMACGCPVITCPNASIPEVAGEAAIYVNDDDVNALANALCEVQKSSVRNSLITAGLAQAKKFSWSTMANTVSATLIKGTILHLNLQEINLIVFPDWSQPEELISFSLERVIKTLAAYSDSQKTTLLIDTNDIASEDAAILLSSVTMNLLMQEDLDISEGLEISLVGHLSDIQWAALLPRISARIILEYENKQAVEKCQQMLEQLSQCNKLIEQCDIKEFTHNYELSNKLYSLLAKFQQENSDTSVLKELRLLRRKIAESWIGKEEKLLERLYLSKFGEAYQLLLNSGIQNESITGSEQSFITDILARYTKGFNEQNAIQYLLVAMLYCRPHQLPSVYDLTKIPSWFLNDYLKFTFKPPLYFQEIGEVDNYYQYMENFINYLHRNIISNSDSKFWQDIAEFFTYTANCIPLYFNKVNLKNIYTKRADIMKSYLQKFNQSIEYEFPEYLDERIKIRVGILASHFEPQTETFATLSVFKHLNRDLFEVILFTLNVSNHRLQRYCTGHADAIIQLPNNLINQVQTIREADLDVLFISTNVTAVTHQITLLSLYRLARIQMVDANSPVTTGMPHIDYYISSKLSETEDNAQEHYTEQLITLNSPPQCFDFATEEQIIATSAINRESLGIEKTAIVYVSGANYYKIIPEQEVTWAKIIASVPNSVLLLYPFNPNWSSSYPCIAFRKRLITTFAKYGLSEDRLIILDPAPNRADVKERLKLCDIYLDSYPYSGMTSLIDPLEVGLPTVVMETEPSRSRKGASLLRELQIFDLITNSEEAYIELAAVLGISSELRRQQAEQINQKMHQNPIFLDSRSHSAQMGELFQELFYKHQMIALKEQLNLKDINLIIFPDWSQPEDLLYQDLASVISTLTTHPDKSNLTLLIDTQNITEEEADMLLSSLTMNLLMEDDVDITEGPEISLLGKMSHTQWKTLLPRIHTRIALVTDNQSAIAQAKVENLPSCDVDSLTAY
ncbi:MAG: class I SAM-dependent methyltransferase [Nostoc sp.]